MRTSKPKTLELTKYKPTFNGRAAYRTMQNLDARIAWNRGQMPAWLRGRVKSKAQGHGIGDVVVPTSGAFAGVPLYVMGFGGGTLQMDAATGLPFGKVGYLVCELVYSRHDCGQCTGLTIELPNDEI